ncbi:hypothetical protein CLF_109137 [Clonorchis sinensis]|uniref:Uncharacterized protein n=1 Tax=Clonorchis sinensis TaxID=79923 RepID=G7YSA2_CLOSI|nr:hypothetical protein CLF_109137 [Clonorchis sinensis]
MAKQGKIDVCRDNVWKTLMLLRIKLRTRPYVHTANVRSVVIYFGLTCHEVKYVANTSPGLLKSGLILLDARDEVGLCSDINLNSRIITTSRPISPRLEQTLREDFFKGSSTQIRYSKIHYPRISLVHVICELEVRSLTERSYFQVCSGREYDPNGRGHSIEIDTRAQKKSKRTTGCIMISAAQTPYNQGSQPRVLRSSAIVKASKSLEPDRTVVSFRYKENKGPHAHGENHRQADDFKDVEGLQPREYTGSEDAKISNGHEVEDGPKFLRQSKTGKWAHKRTERQR